MKLNKLARSLALIGLGTQIAGLALAQQATPPVAPVAPAKPVKIERIEVTGSSIKRIADEGALPLEIITATQIQQQGLNSAEELLRSLSANSANADNAVSSNSVFGEEAARLAGGGAYANLRGLGPTGTLVLLNGRRLSNQGMSGGAVDLNAIPLEMIERVEVLKDGASAIYGTDAIGGVINFILKRNYTGLQASATYSTPEASGGGQRRKVTVSGGWGELDVQGFNLMGSISSSRNTILRGVDRDFALGYQPERGLIPDTTSSPMFGNILNSANTALPSAGSTIGTGTTKYTILNGLALRNQCDAAPFGVSQLGNIGLFPGYAVANSTYRCGTDYGRQYMLSTPSETTSGVLRATFNLGREATGFVEYVGSRYHSTGEFTPFQFSTTSAPSSVTATSNPTLHAALVAAGINPAGNGTALANYPVNGPHYVNMKALFGANDFDPTKPIAYRMRMWDWGYRTLGNTSTNKRLAVGAEGGLGNYDYKVSLSRGEAEGYTEMVDGYADTNKLVTLLASGKYNPFLMPGQTQSAEAMKLVEESKVQGRIFGGKTRVDEFIANISGPLMKLPAGDMAFAAGTNLRREFYGFSGSQTFTCVSTFSSANLNQPNSVMGCPGNAAAPNRSREIGAVYGELLIPVFKTLELQAAVRYDRYQQIGGTTNPKLAFRFTPTRDLLFRGSANTGFRAPTPQQLNLGTVQLATTGTLVDPVKCPDPTQAGTNPACQLSSVPYLSGGNPNLKPEKSRQATLGMVFSPMQNVQTAVDYWQVKMVDRIHNLTVSQQLANYSVFADNFIRDANGNLVLIRAGWINSGGSMTKGLDFAATHSFKLFGNNLSTRLTATKMISAKDQLIVGTPMRQSVGNWTNRTLYLPWKAALSSTYKTQQTSTTLSMNYSSGYNDEDHTNFTAKPEFQKRKIASYTTFNLVGSYTGIKNLSLSAGVLNLFDRTPPFTWHNVDGAVGTGWDPRVADPRGRTVQMTAKYTFF